MWIKDDLQTDSTWASIDAYVHNRMCEQFFLCASRVAPDICYCGIKFITLMVDEAALYTHGKEHVEHGASAVEWWTRIRESPGSNPLYNRFEAWAFSFSPLSCINKYLAIDSGGNLIE